MDPTDLVAYRDDSDPVPDVWAMDNTYGVTFPVAWVDCPAAHSGIGGTGSNRWCRGQYLRFNASWEPTYSGEENEMACHELGHTVGLTHNTHNYAGQPETYDSCMRTDLGSFPSFYSVHETATHINGNY